MLLDLRLEGGSGFDVLDRVRAADGLATRIDPDLPVIVLTGRAGEADRVRSFERGADDHVCKPFLYAELLARVRAVLRRADGRRRQGVLRVRDLTIDPTTRVVRLAGRRIELSAKEFALLHALAEEPTRVYRKQELLRDVWGYLAVGRTRTLDAHACRLRKKLAPSRAALGGERARRGLQADGGAVTFLAWPSPAVRPGWARSTLRRRLELVARRARAARAGRGAGAACERLRREPRAVTHAAALRVQLDRLDAGLADLRDARRRGRLDAPRRWSCAARPAALAPWEVEPGAVAFGWRGGPGPALVDRGALAKALGNLLANAAEHGVGEISVRGRTTGAGVRIEIRNANRPDASRLGARALAIAERAARGARRAGAVAAAR